MLQIDFRQSFSLPPERTVTSNVDHPSQSELLVRAKAQAKGRFADLPPLSRQEWVNLAFVVVTFVGGLFCAFHFFNTEQVWRAAAAWSREYLYPRPFDGLRWQTDTEKFRRADTTAVPPSIEHVIPAERSGNPFGRNIGVLNPNPLTPGGRIAGANRASGPGTATDPTSLLNHLNLFAPGGDILSQNLNRGLSTDVAQVSDSVTAAASQVREARAAKMTRPSRMMATNSQAAEKAPQKVVTAAKPSGRSVQNGKQQIKSAGFKAGRQSAASNVGPVARVGGAAQGANANRSSGDAGQQTIGTVRPMTLSPLMGGGSVRGPGGFGGGGGGIGRR